MFNIIYSLVLNHNAQAIHISDDDQPDYNTLDTE